MVDRVSSDSNQTLFVAVSVGQTIGEGELAFFSQKKQSDNGARPYE